MTMTVCAYDCGNNVDLTNDFLRAFRFCDSIPGTSPDNDACVEERFAHLFAKKVRIERASLLR